MDTSSNEKKAAGPLTGPLDLIRDLTHDTNDLLKAYLTYSAMAGLIGGGALGFGASAIKRRNPEIKALDRRKRFYDSQVEEMKNTNWLNEVMASRRKLESGKLTPEERKTLEQKYIELLSK